LALEQIDNYTIVPLEVPVPRGVSQLDQLLVSSTLPVWFLDVRFLHDTVQVFMQPVQQKSDQLLGIVLLIANKLRGESLEGLFELSRGVRSGCRGVGPYPTKKSTKTFSNGSVHPKGVIRVEFIFEYSCCECDLSTLLASSTPNERTNEVLAEFLGMCQTLEGRVHETSVSPAANENSNGGVGRRSHMLPSPSVPGSGGRFEDVGVLLFQRDILEEVEAAGLASSVLDPKLLVCIFPKKSLPDPKSGAGVWFSGFLSNGH